MSTGTPKKTPQKKEKEELKRTPIRTHLVTRAAALQARKGGQDTPDEKKEQEARKESEVGRRRKATPRKPKEQAENKQDEGEVHTSESEASEEGEKTEELKVETNDTTTQVDKHISDAKATHDSEPKVTQVLVKEVASHTTTHTHIEPESKVKEEAADTKAIEEELLRGYNSLWEAENKLREKINDRERRRRIKATRKIDQEYEKRMAELYSHPSGSKSDTVSTPSEGFANTTIENGSDDEEEKLHKLESELAKAKAALDEKDQLIGKLQKSSKSEVMQNPTVVQALTQLEEKRKREETTFSAGRKELEGHVQKLLDENKLLKTEMQDLKRQGEEKQKLVNEINEALATETASIELRQKQLLQREEQLQAERDQIHSKVAEKAKQLEAKEQTIEGVIKQRVHETLHAMKTERNRRVAQAVVAKPPAIPSGGGEEEDNIQEEAEANEEEREYDNARNEYVVTNPELDQNEQTSDNEPEGELYDEEYENTTEGGQTPLKESARKRRRLENDEVDEMLPGEEIEPNEEIEAGDFLEGAEDWSEEAAAENGNQETVTSKVYRKILKPYGRKVATVATAAGVVAFVNYANQLANYLPGSHVYYG